jgi:hypothetical protein
MNRSNRSVQGLHDAAAWKRNRAKRARHLRPLIEAIESRLLLSVGGGFTSAGLQGAYYNNMTLTGAPSFTRSDVRVAFNWGATQAPGGSTDAGFNAIGITGYSVQWTGAIIPAFNETYTFKATADDGVRLYIKPTGSSTWTALINNWSDHTATSYTAPGYAMTAGQSYDIKLQHYEHTNPGEMILQWFSPSTPLEVIDPLTQSGYMLSGDPSAGDGALASAYTNIVNGARNWWSGVNDNSAIPMDASGWPTSDGKYYFETSANEGLGVDPLMLGKITFSFTGKATISINGNVDTSKTDSTPFTYTYDANTNTTSGSFYTVDKGVNASWFTFTNSTRNGQVGGPAGITNLQLMRPTAPNATTSYTSNVVFVPQFESAIENNFTFIRFQLIATQQMNWSDRTLPSYFNQNGGATTAPHLGVGSATDNGPSWEDDVMLANETGRDMMISLPPVASDQYITNLANLLKYGSDANGNPYTAPAANPVHPGLNSNLHVYLEIGNELWNVGYPFSIDFKNIDTLAIQHADANDADFKIINYDNLSTAKDTNGNYVSLPTWHYREIVLRVTQISDLFRSVYGNAAMPNAGNPDAVIRPLYEWQYDNVNQTAQKGLAWAESYFDNADGTQHVTTPHPLNYYLWGGGGATYYGADNSEGLTSLSADNNFVTGTGFTFTSTADIVTYTAGNTNGIPAPAPQLFDPTQESLVANNSNRLGYITDNGSISFTFTVPSSQTSDWYAFDFKSVNGTNIDGTSESEQLQVYLDGATNITAKTDSQWNGYDTPLDYAAAGASWGAKDASILSSYYYTTTFELSPGTQHTITIRGAGGPNGLTGQTAYFTDVRVTSADAIYANNDIPGGGEAAGQPAGEHLISTMNTEVDWAKAFGLQELSYEGGWSLGGDDHGSSLQDQAKYNDPRTATAEEAYQQDLEQAGIVAQSFGAYPQWSSWNDYTKQQGLLNPTPYPLVQGIDVENNSLPAAPTNGVYAPATLTPSGAAIFNGANTTGLINTAGGFINWMIIVPHSGYYALSLTTSTTGGTAALWADGIQIASGASGGSAITGSAYLTAGQHAIAVRDASGIAFTVNQVTVASQGAPVSPALNPVSSSAASPGNDGQVNLNWNTVSGATGYVVRYGTSPGNYLTRIDIGNVTSHTVTGLTTGQQYYFAIDSYNANGESSPSNSQSTIPLTPGETGTLALWNIGVLPFGATSAAVSTTSSDMTASDLTLGAGLQPTTNTYFSQNKYAGLVVQSAGAKWGTDLSTAITNQEYYTFTITPQNASLDSLHLESWFWNNPAGEGVGLAYSTDGANFSTVGSVTGSQVSSYTFDLSWIDALQNVNGPITFRVYCFGAGSYVGLSDLNVSGHIGSSTATIPINNASFENAAGYWKSEVAPSSWGGGTSADREERVLSGTGTPAASNIGVAAVNNSSMNPNVVLTSGYDGANVLQIPGDPATSGVASTYSFLTDVGTVALGTYAANTTYTLTVALGASPIDTQHNMRSDVIALAASSNGFASGTGGKFANWASVVASNSVAWNSTNFPKDPNTGKADLYDYTVTLDTGADPSVVGESIGVLLGQLVGTGATYNANGYFDNVRLISQPDALHPLVLGANQAIGRVLPAGSAPSSGGTGTGSAGQAKNTIQAGALVSPPVAANPSANTPSVALAAGVKPVAPQTWKNLNAFAPAATWTFPTNSSNDDPWLILDKLRDHKGIWSNHTIV